MSGQVYFKHSIIFSGDQQDVENEINVFTKDKYIEVFSVNVTPERVGDIDIDGHKFPKYIYHITIVYG